MCVATTLLDMSDCQMLDHAVSASTAELAYVEPVQCDDESQAHPAECANDSASRQLLLCN